MNDSYHEDQKDFGHEWLRSHESLVMKAWSYEGHEGFDNKGNPVLNKFLNLGF